MAAPVPPSHVDPLGNLLKGNVSEINWLEAVDQENNLREPKRSEIVRDGIKTVVDYIENEDNGVKKKIKVITNYKVITKKVPRVVAERKKWAKFGQSRDDGPGPNIKTTYMADEVELQLLHHNQFGEADETLLDDKRGGQSSKGQPTKGAHCRLCKSDEHWSMQCPYKDHFKDAAEGEESDAGGDKSGAKGGIGMGGRYVPPSQRGGPGAGGEQRTTMTGTERASDDTTVRITNLPEDSDTLDEDLRAKFQSAGRILRSYVARDKQTNKPKGFAFITFATRQDAEQAIQRFNGDKFEHLILKVEWTKQSGS